MKRICKLLIICLVGCSRQSNNEPTVTTTITTTTTTAVTEVKEEVIAAHALLRSKNGPGNDFLGWLDWPVDYDKEELERIILMLFL